MSFLQMLWDYTPTPQQPVAFVVVIVVAGMMTTFGLKLIRSAARQK